MGAEPRVSTPPPLSLTRRVVTGWCLGVRKRDVTCTERGGLPPRVTQQASAELGPHPCLPPCPHLETRAQNPAGALWRKDPRPLADKAEYVAGKKPGPPGHSGSCLRAAQQEREPRTPGRRTELRRCWYPAAAAPPPQASAPSSRKSAWTYPGWCSHNRQLFTCPSLLLVVTPVPPAPPGRCDSEYMEKWVWGLHTGAPPGP